MPNFPPRFLIPLVDPFCGLFMKLRKHRSQGRGINLVHRSTDKVVVIRKSRPSFELPMELSSKLQQTSLKNIQAIRITEIVLLLIGGSRDEIGVNRAQMMGRSMRPSRILHLAEKISCRLEICDSILRCRQYLECAGRGRLRPATALCLGPRHLGERHLASEVSDSKVFSSGESKA